MIAALTKPIELLEKSDLDELKERGWPESENVEYKSRLSEDDKIDSWSDQRKLSESAKRPILKAIVAFANTSGGRLFLGIDETSDKPPRASNICPIPACHELAERVEQAVINLADPPLSFFRIMGVETESDGAGVLVADVSASVVGPHRSRLDLQSYIRKDANSVPISMREIHDIVIRLSGRQDEIKYRLAERSRLFHEWLGYGHQESNPVVGFRVTALPVGAPLYVERIFRNPQVSRSLTPVNATTVASGTSLPKLEFYPTATMFDERKILGGVRRMSAKSDEKQTRYEIMRDGLIDVWFQWRAVPREEPPRLSFHWVFANSANALVGIDAFRDAAQSPMNEYAMVLEFIGSNGPALIPLKIGMDSFQLGERYIQMDTPSLFGPYEVGDKDVVINTILRDLTDATNMNLDEVKLEIEWPTL